MLSGTPIPADLWHSQQHALALARTDASDATSKAEQWEALCRQLAESGAKLAEENAALRAASMKLLFEHTELLRVYRIALDDADAARRETVSAMKGMT